MIMSHWRSFWLAGVASAKKIKSKESAAQPQQHLSSIVSIQHTQRWHTHLEADEAAETAEDAVDLAAEEEVVIGVEEEVLVLQEAVVEVSFTSPRRLLKRLRSGRALLLALAQTKTRPKVADRRVRRSR